MSLVVVCVVHCVVCLGFFDRHVSFMRICDCHMFHLLPHFFFAYFSKVHVSHIFSAQIGIFDGNFDIVSVSITYLY